MLGRLGFFNFLCSTFRRILRAFVLTQSPASPPHFLQVGISKTTGGNWLKLHTLSCYLRLSQVP
jgi:hypothetical protein